MFADDWIWTADLWCRKRPLNELSHNPRKCSTSSTDLLNVKSKKVWEDVYLEGRFLSESDPPNSGKCVLWHAGFFGTSIFRLAGRQAGRRRSTQRTDSTEKHICQFLETIFVSTLSLKCSYRQRYYCLGTFLRSFFALVNQIDGSCLNNRRTA